MAKFKATYHLDVQPKHLYDALVDFTDQRPQWWPMLAPKHYQKGPQGKGWAKIREGSTKPVSVWAWEKYEYAWNGKSGKVRWTIQDSNIAKEGGYVEARLSPEGSGTKVELDYNRQAKSLKGRLAGVMMQAMGPKILGSGMKKTAKILREKSR